MNNTTGWALFEQTIQQGFATSTGDSILVGLLLLVFFVGYVLLQGTRLDAKIVVLVPAFFLALAFLPYWTVIPVAFIIIVLGWMAITKLFNR